MEMWLSLWGSPVKGDHNPDDMASHPNNTPIFTMNLSFDVI
jgi:hypothetical protein